MLLANVLLILLFVYANYAIWEVINFHRAVNYFLAHGNGITGEPQTVTSGPFFIYNHGVDMNGGTSMFNSPFWIFFVAIAVNIYFMFKLQKTNETKQNIS